MLQAFVPYFSTLYSSGPREKSRLAHDAASSLCFSDFALSPEVALSAPIRRKDWLCRTPSPRWRHDDALCETLVPPKAICLDSRREWTWLQGFETQCGGAFFRPSRVALASSPGPGFLSGEKDGENAAYLRTVGGQQMKGRILAPGTPPQRLTIKGYLS